jgi:FtsZ-interacting cell division protein ZipA
MPMWLIWVIVAVIVVIAIVAIVMAANKKRTEQHRTQAEELRTEASTQAGGLTESQRSAEEARAQAELAKAEADRAAERAAAAEQGHQVEQATYEDKLREADRVDPDVNTKSADYEPSVWNDQSTAEGSTSDTAATEDPSGSHRAAPGTTTSSDDATLNETPTEQPRTTE